MSLLRIPGEGILAVLPDLRQGLKESAAKLEAHGTSPRRAGMSPARSFPPMSGNPAPSAELVSSWLSLRAVHPVFLQTGVRTLYTVYAEGPRPPGAAGPLHTGAHAPHLARARPVWGPSGHRGRGPTTTTTPPQHRRVPHWGPGGRQNGRGKTPPPAQGRRSRRAPPPGGKYFNNGLGGNPKATQRGATPPSTPKEGGA